MKVFLQIIYFIFPWKLRRFLLKKTFGFDIAPSAHIGFSIIMASKLKMENNSQIASLTICNRIDLMELKCHSILGTFIYITGYSTKLKDHFQHVPDRKCELIIGEHSAITSRHFIECTAGIYIGKYTTVAGIRSQILTHSIDLKECIQDAKAVNIGDYCFVGTGSVILKGAALPDYSVLGALSLLNKAHKEPGCLYGGVPAVKIAELKKEDYKYFRRKEGFVK